MTEQKQQKRIRDSWSKISAIVILASLVVSIFWVIPSMLRWNDENNNLQKARTFHIVFGFNFDGSDAVSINGTHDIETDLAITYPHGTLIVDDQVTISGTAVLNLTRPEKTYSIHVLFQNALDYPVSQNADNITLSRSLRLAMTDNETRLTGTKTFTWAVEGTYYPMFAVNFFNGTESYSAIGLQSPDVAITVHPKADSAQITNNNVAMILGIVVYGLTLVGTFSLVLSLWDRNVQLQNPKNETENCNTSTQVNEGHSQVHAGKGTDDEAKPRNKWTKKHKR